MAEVTRLALAGDDRSVLYPVAFAARDAAAGPAPPVLKGKLPILKGIRPIRERRPSPTTLEKAQA